MGMRRRLKTTDNAKTSFKKDIKVKDVVPNGHQGASLNQVMWVPLRCFPSKRRSKWTSDPDGRQNAKFTRKKQLFVMQILFAGRRLQKASGLRSTLLGLDTLPLICVFF